MVLSCQISHSGLDTENEPDGPPVPVLPVLPDYKADKLKIVIAVKGTAQFCLKAKLKAKRAKTTAREDSARLMESHHSAGSFSTNASGSFHTYDLDACYTQLGMRFNTLLSNSWDEAIFNAKYAIEQHMDACVKRLIQIKSFIENVPGIDWHNPSESVINKMLKVVKTTPLEVATVGYGYKAVNYNNL